MRGFTLVELVVTVGIGSLLIAAVSLLVTRGFAIPREQFEQAHITEDARNEIGRIAQAIRNGRSFDLDGDGQVESGPVIKSTVYEVQLYTNIDTDATSELVRYFLAGAELKRGVIKPTAAGLYLPANESVTTRLRSVRNQAQNKPLFTYYTRSDGLINRVGIRLLIDVDPNQLPAVAEVAIDPVLIRTLPGSIASPQPSPPAPPPTPSPTACVDTRLAGYYKLDDDTTSTSVVTDSSVNNRDGTNFGAARSTSKAPTNFSNTGSFNFERPSSDIVHIPYFGNMLMSNMTLSTWVNLPTLSERGPFMTYGDEINSIALGVGNSSFANLGNNIIVMNIRTDDLNGPQVQWLSTSRAIGTGWHHLALVKENSVPSVYLDGQSVGSYPAFAGAAGSPSAGAKSYIGGIALNFTVAYLVNSLVDEVRYYNAPLAATEIAILSGGDELPCAGSGNPTPTPTPTPNVTPTPSPSAGSVDIQAKRSSAPPTAYSNGPIVVTVGLEQASLRWSSANVTSCLAADAWSGSKVPSGEELVGPYPTAGAQTYTLNCTSSSGMVSDSVVVQAKIPIIP